jgi:L-lactate dehydrogenase complex protein LldG
MRIRTGGDPVIAALPWNREPHLERLVGPSDGSDPVALSRAFAGVAETGTLALLSGGRQSHDPKFSTRHAPRHVECGRHRGDYETVWRRLREVYGPENCPAP